LARSGVDDQQSLLFRHGQIVEVANLKAKSAQQEAAHGSLRQFEPVYQISGDVLNSILSFARQLALSWSFRVFQNDPQSRAVDLVVPWANCPGELCHLQPAAAQELRQDASRIVDQIAKALRH